MAGVIGTNILTQVGFVVRDIEASKRKFAEFLGVEPPEHIDGGQFEITGTIVEGKPAPYANCWMAFFDAGPNVQIELIQPNGMKSTWQDFLDEKGEGIHHIAFQVKNMKKAIESCENFGIKCIQQGKYGNNKGEYAYMDASEDLKCILELLENYE